jgi:hypothetical protein
MILTRKQNPQETLTTTLTTTGTIVTRATMPPKTSTIVTTAKSSTTTEGTVILRGKSSLIFNGRLLKKHMADIFNSFLFAYSI